MSKEEPTRIVTAGGLASDDPLVVEIGIGGIAVVEAPRRIMTPALGSCVGVALWDPVARRGGLAHVMLPAPTTDANRSHVGRYADLAVPELVRRMRAQGSLKSRLVAKIAGGATMFRVDSPAEAIGPRNVAAVKRQLALMSIPLLAEDTGEAHARTVELVVETGELVVRTYQFGVTRL